MRATRGQANLQVATEAPKSALERRRRVEIDLGDERIVELRGTYSPQQVQDMAQQKRVDVFGQVVKWIQRPKPEEIEVVSLQRRLEPFWYAAATARYVYDRRRTFSVPVSPEVKSVSIYANALAVAGETNGAFQLEGIEHCVEESRRVLTLEAAQGHEVKLDKYLAYPQSTIPDVASLGKDGTLVVYPEVRGSFVVRKLVSLLMKTFQADQIHEERIDVEQVTLCFRPVYLIEFEWKPKQRKQAMEFDALTGEFRAASGEIRKQVARALANDMLFDIGADAIGTVLPGASIAVKLGRLAARKVIR
jgi:hypothetical protein